MKTLILIRHAKSSWANIHQKDFDRPLNERGKKDAKEMAKRLYKKKISIDAFISSPARRALKTCEFFVKQFDKSSKDILQIARLYEANLRDFFEVISEVENRFNCIAIFSHNPCITAFANTLTTTRIDDMPTCSIFAVTAETINWQEFENAKKSFLFFDHPKNKE